MNPDIFIMAAELIDKRRQFVGCHAIKDACRRQFGYHLGDEAAVPYLAFFERLLKPRCAYRKSAWYGVQAKSQPRIYGLLLCAELVRRGER